MYWMGTFSSYSLHTLCFGLLIYGETKRSFGSAEFLEKPHSQEVLALSNYQYLPILLYWGAKISRLQMGFFFKR